MDGSDYKVVWELDELQLRAAQTHESAISLGMRLDLREKSRDGTLWAEVAFLGAATGEPTINAGNALPLDSTCAVGWLLGWIAENGFPQALERHTEAMYRRVE